ncbi:hypothetical protein [Trinickia mobilis]|uniref:hypothetical protein n=1 Tax=Trinickia mobilis TaxID=2816356 RepID=UPI001A8E54C8|nr:hypothetical protein [Trinickia mobilis]
MSGSAQTDYTDFTRENYRRLIRLARDRYAFRGYTDDLAQHEQPFVLWRHDIDMSVHAARRLAVIEQEEGVRATYFLWMHSHFYNLFEREISDRIRDIVRMGHEIGLHFDCEYHGEVSEETFLSQLRVEAEWLSNHFDVPVDAFSFHNPDARSLGHDQLHYAGMVNTYAACFRQEIDYCSDSNGYWRHRRLEDVILASPARLQVLTHPEWWTDAPLSPHERVKRCIEGRANAVRNLYETQLAAFGRKNVGS